MYWRKLGIGALKHGACAWGRILAAPASKFRAAGHIACLAALIASRAVPALAQDAADKIEGGLELEKVTGLMNAIVAANREAYSKAVVNRLMIEAKVLKADEEHLKNKVLPLPAQFFRASAELSASKNRTATYSLQSFWSIRRLNFPKTELEKIGLARVLGGTDHFYGAETTDGLTYFIAAYPDVATNEACVTCHNAHPGSRRQDFALGDVMGGVVVRIPLVSVNGQVEAKSILASGANGTRAPRMGYRDAADLVNSIVTANREVYSTLVVDRLVSREKVIAVSEHYVEQKCLPLPEQLFNLGAALAAGRNRTATFALRSAWALNKASLPASPMEKTGLAAVAAGQDRFYGVETSGGAKTLVAVYPDKAVSEACASCHNQHGNSSRRDFKPGDVMGGTVVRIQMSN
jgi:hypothetical protein